MISLLTHWCFSGFGWNMPLKSLKFSNGISVATKCIRAATEISTTTDFFSWLRDSGSGSVGWFWVNIYLCKCMACFPRQFFQWRWHHCILVRQLGFSGLGFGLYHLVLVVWLHSKDHSCSSSKHLNFSRLIRITRTVDGIWGRERSRWTDSKNIFELCFLRISTSDMTKRD